jgi:hypothetical protein
LSAQLLSPYGLKPWRIFVKQLHILKQSVSRRTASGISLIVTGINEVRRASSATDEPCSKATIPRRMSHAAKQPFRNVIQISTKLSLRLQLVLGPELQSSAVTAVQNSPNSPNSQNSPAWPATIDLQCICTTDRYASSRRVAIQMP